MLSPDQPPPVESAPADSGSGPKSSDRELKFALRSSANALRAMRSAWSRLFRPRKLILLLSGAAFAMAATFVLVYVRPFEPPPLSNEALAASWNESISRLSISPVYPPQEDFQVGDLLAVIVGAESTTLKRKFVRVAHIDMRDLILKEQEDRLVFADTKEDEPIRGSDRLDVAASPRDRVALTLASFPGFAIRYSSGANASANTRLWSLIGARTDEQVEEIRIPLAETYGVSPASAVERLINQYISKCTFLTQGSEYDSRES
jgi:hypothetical protein